MNRMFKYRLYPNKTQVAVLNHHIELCRQTHNFLLRFCRDRYQDSGKQTSWFDMNRLLTNLKKHNPPLFALYSTNLTNVSKRIANAYTGFFARKNVGLKAGLPRFKKYGRYRSITYIPNNFKLSKQLYLTRIGDLRINLHRELTGAIKTLTIKKTESGKWFAIFCCEVFPSPKERRFEAVGIDVGISSLATLSDGTIIENPQHYRNGGKRLARLQRRLSRKEKGGNNWKKARVRLARLHERVRNRRSDYLHKVSRQVVDRYDTIYLEDLKILNMVKNRRLAKSISDVGWGKFVRMLCYKAEGAGGRVVFVNPVNTTQRCSGCGKLVPKSLSERIHNCSYCGLVLNRDRNAALNILARGREIGRVSPEFKPEGEMTTTQFHGTAQAVPMKQETSSMAVD